MGKAPQNVKVSLCEDTVGIYQGNPQWPSGWADVSNTQQTWRWRGPRKMSGWGGPTLLHVMEGKLCIGLPPHPPPRCPPSSECPWQVPVVVNVSDPDDLLLHASYVNGKLQKMSRANFRDIFWSSSLITALKPTFCYLSLMFELHWAEWCTASAELGTKGFFSLLKVFKCSWSLLPPHYRSCSQADGARSVAPSLFKALFPSLTSTEVSCCVWQHHKQFYPH